MNRGLSGNSFRGLTTCSKILKSSVNSYTLASQLKILRLKDKPFSSRTQFGMDKGCKIKKRSVNQRKWKGQHSDKTQQWVMNKLNLAKKINQNYKLDLSRRDDLR